MFDECNKKTVFVEKIGIQPVAEGIDAAKGAGLGHRLLIIFGTYVAIAVALIVVPSLRSQQRPAWG